jgi:hypothetical protein
MGDQEDEHRICRADAENSWQNSRTDIGKFD